MCKSTNCTLYDEKRELVKMLEAEKEMSSKIASKLIEIEAYAKMYNRVPSSTILEILNS